MAIDLEKLMDKIMSMAEKGQVQRQQNTELAREDKQWADKLSRITDINKQRDLIAADRYKAELANPMSNLSSSERYIETMKDLAQKNALYPGAQTAQTRENELKAAQSAQAYGTAAYHTGAGANYNAQALTQNALRPGYERMPQWQQTNVLMGKEPNAGIPTSSVSTVATPTIQQQSTVPSYTDTTVKMTPEEQDLINRKSTLGLTPNQDVPGIFGSVAKGAISTIDTLGDLGNYLGDSASSFRRNLNKSNPNIFDQPIY